LFKNFIALWRHLAKPQLLRDAQIYLYSVNKRHYSGVFARRRHRAMKFLNKKLMAVFSIIILQKSTNFHAIRSWSFQNICNEIGWPEAPFFAPPCICCVYVRYGVPVGRC